MHKRKEAQVTPRSKRVALALFAAFPPRTATRWRSAATRQWRSYGQLSAAAPQVRMRIRHLVFVWVSDALMSHFYVSERCVPSACSCGAATRSLPPSPPCRNHPLSLTSRRSTISCSLLLSHSHL